MAKNKLSSFVPEVKEALSKALAEYLNETQGRLGKANPKDTGRMASSWFISNSQPRTDTRPEDWAAPGDQKLELEKFPANKVEFDGSWYIANNVQYAERVALDPTWAKGGAGGADWYRAIEGSLTSDFNETATKYLKRI